MARVYVSSVIPATAEQVWERIRDFNGLPNWHKGMRESRIEDGRPADQVGCVRNFKLQSGEAIRERLLGLSDYDQSCTYAILESPMPVTNYQATLSLMPVTDGDRCFTQWSAEFDCAPHDLATVTNLLTKDVFQAGFDALKRHFGG
jgi:hypothetical protein